MKKLFLVAFAMTAMTFASCGDGKSAETVENDSTAVDVVVVDSTIVDDTVIDTLAVDTIVAE